MLRKLLLAGFTLAVFVGMGVTEEFRAAIMKVEDGKITFNTSKKDDKQEDKSMPVAADVKVFKAKYNEDTKKFEAGDAIEGGLKNEMFTKIAEKGLRAMIITDADNKKITEIRVGGKKK